MKDILIVICIFFIAVVTFASIIPLENRLSDCQFECNHLQTKLNQCEELSDYAIILSQILSSEAWGELRALNEELKQKRHWEYEGREQPLLTK